MVEYALYVNRLEDLKKHFDVEKYQGIYFGNEFCENLIPSVDEVLEAIRFSLDFNVGFTFTTPYVTNKGLKRLKLILEKISRFGCEIVFNDWGFFNILKEFFSGLEFVMGRLLVKYPRDPRILNYFDRLPKDTIEYYRKTNLTIDVVKEFLEKNGVKRIEFDNPLHQIEANFSGFKKTLHYPYVYVTTTRLCLMSRDGLKGVSLGKCGKTCLKNVFTLKNPEMPITLIRKGNTIFYLNQEKPKNLEKIFDRVAVSPKIPI